MDPYQSPALPVRPLQHLRDKVSRFAWVAFLVSALPVVCTCVAVVAVGVSRLGNDDSRPIEFPPSPLPERALMWTSLISHPLLWLLGVCIAWRFNNAWRAVVPFAANLLPLTGLLWIAHRIEVSEGPVYHSVTLYLVGLSGLLLLGLAAVAIDCLQPPSAPA